MQDRVQRFIPRSPRYILRPDDNHYMRFAANDSSTPQATEFINVSESGMAFVVLHRDAPRIGELIKVEFSVPGGEQIAWFAKVVRLEEFRRRKWFQRQDTHMQPDEVVVGVQFHHLPEGHKSAIRAHLQGKFREILLERRRARIHSLNQFFKEHGLKVLLYVGLSILAFTLLYFLSRPSANYDPQRGAPWGQRFKIGF